MLHLHQLSEFIILSHDCFMRVWLEWGNIISSTELHLTFVCVVVFRYRPSTTSAGRWRMTIQGPALATRRLGTATTPRGPTTSLCPTVESRRWSTTSQGIRVLWLRLPTREKPSTRYTCHPPQHTWSHHLDTCHLPPQHTCRPQLDTWRHPHQHTCSHTPGDNCNHPQYTRQRLPQGTRHTPRKGTYHPPPTVSYQSHQPNSNLRPELKLTVGDHLSVQLFVLSLLAIGTTTLFISQWPLFPPKRSVSASLGFSSSSCDRRDDMYLLKLKNWCETYPLKPKRTWGESMSWRDGTARWH